jgi:hypothetical protein
MMYDVRFGWGYERVALRVYEEPVPPMAMKKGLSQRPWDPRESEVRQRQWKTLQFRHNLTYHFDPLIRVMKLARFTTPNS